MMASLTHTRWTPRTNFLKGETLMIPPPALVKEKEDPVATERVWRCPNTSNKPLRPQSGLISFQDLKSTSLWRFCRWQILMIFVEFWQHFLFFYEGWRRQLLCVRERCHLSFDWCGDPPYRLCISLHCVSGKYNIFQSGLNDILGNSSYMRSKCACVDL